ncbi:hypothetical protein J7E49_06985 [Variovorax paradoxus]|nr:hypothetical protein [Variovorax paradoxus]
MLLLRRIASQNHLTELVSSAEIAQAEKYEEKGWVILRRTKMSKGKETYGQQTVYAQITDAGRRALDAAA